VAADRNKHAVAMNWRQILLPEPERELPAERAMRIGLRTAHIAVTGILLGGHVFGVDAARLVPWLWATLLTGGAFVAVELYGTCAWLAEVRGLLWC